MSGPVIIDGKGNPRIRIARLPEGEKQPHAGDEPNTVVIDDFKELAKVTFKNNLGAICSFYSPEKIVVIGKTKDSEDQEIYDDDYQLDIDSENGFVCLTSRPSLIATLDDEKYCYQSRQPVRIRYIDVYVDEIGTKIRIESNNGVGFKPLAVSMELEIPSP